MEKREEIKERYPSSNFKLRGEKEITNSDFGFRRKREEEC